MSSHSKVLWAVCPFLFKDNIYARPRPPFKASRIFQTKADATNWLEEPAIDDHREDGTPIYGTGTNARTWVGPVPVRDLTSYPTIPSLEEDQRLKGFVKIEEIAASQEIDRRTELEHFEQGRHHRILCVLGNGWDTEAIFERVTETPAYEFMGTRVTGPAQQILKVLLELESALFERHLSLPWAAVEDFWFSCQVYVFIAAFCNRLVADPGVKKLYDNQISEDACEEARYFVGRQLVMYTTKIRRRAEQLTRDSARVSGDAELEGGKSSSQRNSGRIRRKRAKNKTLESLRARVRGLRNEGKSHREMCKELGDTPRPPQR